MMTTENSLTCRTVILGIEDGMSCFHLTFSCGCKLRIPILYGVPDGEDIHTRAAFHVARHTEEPPSYCPRNPNFEYKP